MLKKIKKTVAFMLVLGLCFCSNLSVFAASNYEMNTDKGTNEYCLQLVDITESNTRMAKGYNYSFNVADSSGNVYGVISGTVIFDINGNKVTVSSKSTPKVSKVSSNSKVTASSSIVSSGGNPATVKITAKLTHLGFFSNTMDVHISCDAGAELQYINILNL